MSEKTKVATFTHTIQGKEVIFGLGFLDKHGELLERQWFTSLEAIIIPEGKNYWAVVTIWEANHA